MGVALRILLLDDNDDVHRLSTSTFEQMIDNPSSYPLPRFAGARVRMASVLVELVDRKPTRVIRVTYSMLTFDSQGCLDSNSFNRQQWALAESVLGKGIPPSDPAPDIIDAATRFIARGGHWAPSPRVADRIDQTALGHLKCNRLSI